AWRWSVRRGGGGRGVGRGGGPGLLVATPVSVLDPPLVGASAPRPLHFMAKEELFRIPLLGSLIRALNARPVRRDGSDTRALKAALALLQEGRGPPGVPGGARGGGGGPPPAGEGGGGGGGGGGWAAAGPRRAAGRPGGGPP